MSLLDKLLDTATNFIDEVVNDISGQYSNNKLQVAVAGVNVYEAQVNLPVDSFKFSTKKNKPVKYFVSKKGIDVKGSYNKKNDAVSSALGISLLLTKIYDVGSNYFRK